MDPFRLARVDDPHAGFAVEALVGLLLADSAAAAGPQGRFSGGLRGTWEFGRAIALEPYREALLLDLGWWASGAREGTAAVFSREALHLFTVAPAWNFRLSPQAPWSFYLQAGAGLAWQLADVTASGQTTDVSGVRPVLQYGLGLRARPGIDERLSLTFRLELTRFRRGYLDDTWIGVVAARPSEPSRAGDASGRQGPPLSLAKAPRGMMGGTESAPNGQFHPAHWNPGVTVW